MTSTIPDPQTPVIPVRRVDAANPVSSDQRLEPMTRNRGSSVSRSIRTRSMAPGAARWPQLICAPSKAGPVGERGREQSGPAPEHDLGVRADIHEQRDLVPQVRRLGQDHACRVGAHVAGDARQQVRASARVDGQLQLDGRRPDRAVRGQREWRRAQGHGIDAQHEVMHDRVPDQRDLQDVGGVHLGAFGEARHERRQRVADGAGHLCRSAVMQHRVRDAAHEVLAEPDLRVHHAVGREDGAIREIGEVAGDRR